MALSLAPHHKGGEGRHIITYRCPERLIKKSEFGVFSFQVFPICQTLVPADNSVKTYQNPG